MDAGGSRTFTRSNPHDIELLVVQRVIRFEDEMDAEVSLDLLENRIVGVVQGTVDDRVETDDDVLPFVQVAQLHQLAPDLEGDGRIRLDPTTAAAIRTGLRQRALQALAHALARHLDQAEL